MNIWYFNHYAGGPGLGKFVRAYHLARIWAKLGHETTVFVASFHHMLDKLEPLRGNVDLDGARYVPLESRVYDGNGFGRILNMIDYSRAAARLPSRVPADFEKPDAIIVSSPHPFAIRPAARLAKRYGAQLTFEVRDLWPLSLTEINGNSSFHPFVLFTAFTERFAYRKCDLVASLLGGAEEYMRGKGLAAGKFAHVPNGVPAGEQMPPAQPVTEAGRAAARKIAEWKDQGRVVLIHPGAQGTPNGLDRLLSAVALLKAEGRANGFGVLLVGRGTMTESLMQQARTLRLDNICFVDTVPKQEALWLISRSDAGYSGAQNKPALYIYGTSFNKTIDFMRSSLPVLLPIHAPSDPVAIAGCGVVTGSDEPRAIARAIAEMVAMTPEQRAAMGARGRQYVLETLNYDRIARDYVAWIEKTRPRR